MKDHFRTIVTPAKSEFSFSHKDSILLLGSCFSQHMGNQLKLLKFDALNNPLGISYNPISIHKLLILEKKIDIKEKEGIYFSYQLHSELNELNKSAIEANYENKRQVQESLLAKNGVLMLTYGTAWVHQLKENSTIVNNCQKQPSALFTKRLLTVHEIVDSFKKTYEELQKNTPQKQIIFTISPVRHLKDGIHENQISKSVLHLAIHQLCKEIPLCSYFPSYEIMMDDLRDYRFYEADLLHPNQQAINYIWQQFSCCYFSLSTQQLNEKIQRINTSLNHRAFQLKSEKHQKFLSHLLSQVQQLVKEHGFNFDAEMLKLEQQIL